MDKDIYAKQRCVGLNKGLADNKLVKLSFGNASVRDRDDNRIFIKPSGLLCGDLYNQQIACVDLATGAHLYGGKPSVDTAIHLEIYRTFPEILAVTHTHSTAATSWAQAGEAIPCFGTTHADYFSGAVPVMPLLSEKEIVANYEENLGKLIVNWFQSERVSPLDCPAVLIPFHGCLTFGATADKALEAAIALEEIAQLALNTRMIAPAGHRPNYNPLVSFLFKKHFDRKHGLNKYYGQNSLTRPTNTGVHMKYYECVYCNGSKKLETFGKTLNCSFCGEWPPPSPLPLQLIEPQIKLPEKPPQPYGVQEVPAVAKAHPPIEKYWGSITTVVAEENFTLKNIFMRAGTQSSMEYHVKKDEHYYVVSGKLKVGLRIGRAENKSVVLGPGDVFHIKPGLMHMRIALEDTVIIEWSNKDDDSDSNIVEDGKTYTHVEI